MSSTVKFVCPNQVQPLDSRITGLLSACGHYYRSDKPLFISGYNELCRHDLNGKRALEVCCYTGELALGVGRVFPQAEIFALDRWPDSGAAIREVERSGNRSNVRFIQGDALNLCQFPDESLDMVWGQAALHHLGHDTERLRHEFARVLKPGGRLVFIFEPLGTNPLFAMIRAFNIARQGLPDESNVVMCQLNEIARSFSSAEVHPFNLLGYPFKALGKIAGDRVSRGVYSIDRALMCRSDRFARWAANFNAVFTK